MKFYNLISVTFCFLLIIRSSTSDGDWWMDTRQLSFILRVELFSFASGTHFLTAHANETNNCSVSNDERTIALTVVIMLQRLPIMIAVNRVVDDVVCHLFHVASKPRMRTFLQKLDGELRKDTQLRKTFLQTKFTLASVIKQLPESDCIPHDNESNSSLLLLRWSRNANIRSFLVGNMFINYHGLLDSKFSEPALLVRILIRLSRDSTDGTDTAVKRFYEEAVSSAVECSLKANDTSYHDFQFSANFLWYNAVANETLFGVLNRIRRDEKLESKFYKMRNEFWGRTGVHVHHHVMTGSVLQLLLEALLFCSSLFLMWSGGRYIHRKYRSESLPDWLDSDWDDSASLSELLIVDENEPINKVVYGPLVLCDPQESDDNNTIVKMEKNSLRP